MMLSKVPCVRSCPLLEYDSLSERVFRTPYSSKSRLVLKMRMLGGSGIFPCLCFALLIGSTAKWESLTAAVLSLELADLSVTEVVHGLKG